MRKWLILSITAAFLLTLTTTAVIKAARTDLQPANIELNPKYLPGSPRPDDSFCDSHMTWGDVQYCNEYPNTAAGVSFAFDRTRKVITHTSMLSFGLNVGDLIALWGQPTSYRVGGWAVQVFWGNRSAYMVMQSFSPQSRVIFITYESIEEHCKPWAGFITIPNRYR
jgi:hypothetical protein